MASPASSGMIRMSDVASALELFKESRMTSSGSLSSWATAAATPPATTSPSTRGDRSDRTATDSVDTSMCSSPESANRFSLHHDRSVRFADECGGDLVSDVRTATDWWEEMVFGVDTCARCGYVPRSADRDAADAAHTSAGERNSGTGAAGTAESQGCERCGALGKREAPGELFHFIEELSRGVEATLILPGLLGKKRRSVILYTEDNGESLCWMESGGSQTGEAYRLPCCSLLEVTDTTKTTAVTAAAGCRRGNDVPHSGKRRERPKCRDSRGIQATGAEARREQLENTANGSLSNSLRSVPSTSSWQDGGGGVAEGKGGIRFKLRWRVKPNFPVRKVTIADIRCSNPSVFARGLLQLRGHNVELDQDCT